MCADVNDYLKVLKKNKYVAEQFNYDSEQYVANKKLESELNVKLKGVL